MTLALTASRYKPKPFFVYPQPDNFWWLHHWLWSMESRAAIRLALLAFPTTDVVIRMRASGDISPDQLTKISSTARNSLRTRGAAHQPLIVLTEGSSDAELLRGALEVLHPHLTDLVQFLDFDALPSGQRASGGARDIAPKIRTLLGSGIKQRIVAVYDNDLAGRTALAELRRHPLPPDVAATCYPDLELARAYPAYGQPGTPEQHRIIATDINGTAASIELYLGRDSLTNPEDGDLYPVKWTRESRHGRFQGVVDHKKAVQDHFRNKLLTARANSGCLPDQDWSGVLLLLDHVLHAHHTPTPSEY
jgi:hypothetical protein